MKLETEDLGLGFLILVLILTTWIGYAGNDTGVLLIVLFISLVVLAVVVRMPKLKLEQSDSPERSEGKIQPQLEEVKHEVLERSEGEKPIEQPVATKPIQEPVPEPQPEPFQEEPVPQAMFLQCNPVPEVQAEPKPTKHRRKRRHKRKAKPKPTEPIPEPEPIANVPEFPQPIFREPVQIPPEVIQE